jgi:hypothetical protein
VETCRQLETSPPPLVCPAGQNVQTRSVVAEGVFDTYVFTGQVLHAAQLEALPPELKLPSAQSVHTASAVLVAGLLT